MNLLVLGFTLFIKVFDLFDVIFNLMVNSTSIWDTLFGISFNGSFITINFGLSILNMWVSVNKRYIRCLMVGMS